MIKEDRKNRTPAAFLGYQQRWSADTAQVKLCEKSRRIGLTWCEAGEDALLAASESGMDVWYIGYNKDMATEFIEDCADWSKHFNQAAGEIEEFIYEDETAEKRAIKAYRIRFSSGHKITALSSRPANIRGKQGKIVIDEAAFHPDLAGLLKAALAMLIWGGKVVIISTHNGDSNLFNELIQEIKAKKVPYSLHRITFDDALNDGLYKRVCLRRGIDFTEKGQIAWRKEIIDQYGSDADEELFCIPSQGSGVYLPRTLVQSCMTKDVPVVRWQRKDDFAQMPKEYREKITLDFCEDVLRPLIDDFDPEKKSFMGEDFGRSGDLTVLAFSQENQDLSYSGGFALELRNIPFEQQKQIVFYICDRIPKFYGAALDSRGNGEYLGEVAMQRYGSWRIHQVKLSQPWYITNFPTYKSALEDRSIALPKDKDILDDHRAVVMDKGVAKVPDSYSGKGQDGKGRHGDAVIAYVMLWFAIKNCEYGPMESESTGPRETISTLDRY